MTYIPRLRANLGLLNIMISLAMPCQEEELILGTSSFFPVQVSQEVLEALPERVFLGWVKHAVSAEWPVDQT